MANRPGSSPDLREKAETQARMEGIESTQPLAPEQTEHLLHELRVHQIELEMQNEELRHAQEALEASRNRYFDLYDLAPVGYLMVSENGIILEANLTTARMLGINKNALSSRLLSRFVARDDRDICYLYLRQLFQTGTPQVCELRMERADGGVFWARLEATLAQEADGTPVCRTTMSDITDRKRAEEALEAYSGQLEEIVSERTRALEEAQEKIIHQERLAVLGQLAGGVGHELRNPLGAIKNALYALHLFLDAPQAEVQEMLEVMDKEIVRSEKIVASLFDFAHPTAPVRQQVDVNAILRETLSYVMVPAHVLVDCHLAPLLPQIIGDPDQLLQIFSNIALNAVQAMPDGGTMTITTAVRDPGWVSIAMTDTGVGITQENMSRIFEPLFTTKSKGIGLGLTVTKKLVEGHQGRIEVQSQAGEGTTFAVHLPVE